MKITVPTDVLIDLLTRAGAAVAKRTTMPILQHVLLEATGTELSATGTDQEIVVQARSTNFECKKSGSCALDPVKVAAVLRASGAGSATIETAGPNDEITILAGRGKYKFNGMDTDSYPKLEDVPLGEAYHEVKAADAKAGIAQTVYAASKTEESRFVTSAMRWAIDSGSLTFSATDSHRIAQTIVPAVVVGETSIECLVPVKSISTIIKAMGDDDELVHVLLGNNNIVLRGPNWTVKSLLMEGRFPPCEKVKPKKAKLIATVNLEKWISALSALSCLTDETSQRVDFEFKNGDSSTLLMQVSAEHRSGESEITVESLSGDDVTIGIDPKYVLDVLRACPKSQSTVTIKLTDSDSPVLFQEPDSQSWSCVMPMGGSR